MLLLPTMLFLIQLSQLEPSPFVAMTLQPSMIHLKLSFVKVIG